MNWPLARVIMSRFACLLARPLTPVRDATSGFFLIRRAVVHGVRIEAGGFKICLELLLRGPVTSVAEVPYTFVDRTTGQSKMSTREALGYFTQLRQLLWSNSRAGRRIRGISASISSRDDRLEVALGVAVVRPGSRPARRPYAWRDAAADAPAGAPLPPPPARPAGPAESVAAG